MAGRSQAYTPEAFVQPEATSARQSRQDQQFAEDIRGAQEINSIDRYQDILYKVLPALLARQKGNLEKTQKICSKQVALMFPTCTSPASVGRLHAFLREMQVRVMAVMHAGFDLSVWPVCQRLRCRQRLLTKCKNNPARQQLDVSRHACKHCT